MLIYIFPLISMPIILIRMHCLSLQKIKTFFFGSPDCEEPYKQNDISKERYIILKEGEEWDTEGTKNQGGLSERPDA